MKPRCGMGSVSRRDSITQPKVESRRARLPWESIGRNPSMLKALNPSRAYHHRRDRVRRTHALGRLWHSKLVRLRLDDSATQRISCPKIDSYPEPIWKQMSAVEHPHPGEK